VENFIGGIISYWWIAGLILGALWGVRAVVIFTDEQDRGFKKVVRAVLDNFTVNFVGAFAGCCCVYFLAIRAKAVLSNPQAVFGLGDFVLFLLFVLGLTGNLPQTMAGILNSIGKIVETVTKKVVG